MVIIEQALICLYSFQHLFCSATKLSKLFCYAKEDGHKGRIDNKTVIGLEISRAARKVGFKKTVSTFTSLCIYACTDGTDGKGSLFFVCFLFLDAFYLMQALLLNFWLTCIGTVFSVFENVTCE